MCQSQATTGMESMTVTGEQPMTETLTWEEDKKAWTVNTHVRSLRAGTRRCSPRFTDLHLRDLSHAFISASVYGQQ